MSDRRKPKSNAVLKNLPPERQEQIAEWCEKPNETNGDGNPVPKTGGLAYAQTQLANDGLRVSLSVLGDFYQWWRLQKDLEISFEREQIVLEKTGDAKKAREAGENLLMRLGLVSQDPKLIQAAAIMSDSRRALDLEEASGRTKAAQKDRSLSQKDEQIKLAERKFQRDTCALFLKWFDVEAAKKIATSGLSNKEKIDQLGLAMFGEDWNA